MNDALPVYPSGSVRAMLVTNRVTPATREALTARLTCPAVTEPRFFDPSAFGTLQSVCRRLIVPAHGAEPIDIAGIIDTRLAEGRSDGWRYDAMPLDGDAHRLGLRGIDDTARQRFGAAFHQLDAPRQDAVLTAVQTGQVEGGAWDSVPPKLFFEELLAGATEACYAHPLALEDIGYAGMADAQGWQAIGLNQLDPQEPMRLDRTGPGLSSR